MISNAEKDKIRKTINVNNTEVYILSLEEMDYVVKKTAKTPAQKERWEKYKSKVEFSASYYSSGQDIFLFNKLLGDLGFAGARAYVKYYGGKPHIILKGYPGLRKILNATRYGVQNAKVVKMGLGKYGAHNAAKSGGILTIVLLTSYRVIDYFLRDEATLSQLVGALATDIVKVGISTGASILAATGTMAAGTALAASSSTVLATVGTFAIAIGPLAAVILVGIGVSLLLTAADNKFHITDRVIAALDEIDEKGIRGILAEKKHAVIQRGTDMANQAAESVIDYVIETAQEIVIRTVNNLFRRMTIPQL